MTETEPNSPIQNYVADALLNGWQTKQLGSIANVIMGQSPEGSTYNKTGQGLPLLNGPTEFGGRHPVVTVWTDAPTKVSKVGDIIFCVRGSTTGRMNLSDKEYCLGRGVAGIRANRDNDTTFLNYSLISNLDRLLSLCAGSVFPNLSGKDFEGFTIPVPPLAEQRAIAHVLGAFDDKIDLNRRMNETLETMARAVYESWFVRFDPVRAKASGEIPAGMDAATAALFPSAFVDGALGVIPEGWTVALISTLCHFDRSTVIPNRYPEEQFAHFSLPAHDNGKNPSIDYGATILSNKFGVTNDNILISKLNPETPRIWLPVVKPHLRAIASTEFLVVSPSEIASREFLYSLFQSQKFLDTFAGKVTGTSKSHQRVKPDDLMNQKSIVPSVEVINAYTAMVAPLHFKYQTNIEESQTLAALRDALLPKLIRGTVRLPGDMIERFRNVKEPASC